MLEHIGNGWADCGDRLFQIHRGGTKDDCPELYISQTLVLDRHALKESRLLCSHCHRELP